MTEDSKKVVKELYERQAKLAYQIFQKEPSLRLLSAFLQTYSFSTIYKALITNKGMKSLQRAGESKSEKRLLLEWAEKWPAVKREMEISDFTPRKWCGAYGLFDIYGKADIIGIIDPNTYELNHGDDESGNKLAAYTVEAWLKKDFPKAFPGEKLVWYESKEVRPEEYYFHRITHVAGKTRHVLANRSLNIQVMESTFQKAMFIWDRRLREAVKEQRMKYLLQIGVTPENVKIALAWLPKTASQIRSNPSAKNKTPVYDMADQQRKEAAVQSAADMAARKEERRRLRE